MGLKLWTAPTVSPVTLVTMKQHLRVDHTDDDALIQEMIDSATSEIDGQDGWLQRAIMTQTYDLYWDDWPDIGDIQIPLPPLQSVEFIRYFGSDELWHTLSNTEYSVDTSATDEGWVVPGPDGWPSDVFEGINCVHVRFVAGYGSTPAEVPAAIRGALRLMVGSAYKLREDWHEGQIQLDDRVKGALNTYRIWTC